MLWTRLFRGGFGPVYQPLIDTFGDLTEMKFLYRAGLGGIMTSYPWLMLSLFTVISLAACFTLKNTQEKTAQLTLSNKKFLVVVILMLWSIMSLSGISEFLYFNF